MANAAPVKAFPVLAFLKLQSLWVTAVNSTVPEPYLDEVFHVPQAQAYWAGNWTQWDPKLTTPPGLYIFSYAFNSLTRVISRKELVQTTEDLRNVNAVLLWLLFVSLRVFRTLRRREQKGGIIYRELNIMLFPLFFFFSALYYTDLLSALTVMLSYIFWGLGQTTVTSSMVLFRVMHFLSGLLALASRQTNIFWVAIFLGGLQVVQTVHLSTKSSLSPLVSGAGIEGQFILDFSSPMTDKSRILADYPQYRSRGTGLCPEARIRSTPSTFTTYMLWHLCSLERWRCPR